MGGFERHWPGKFFLMGETSGIVFGHLFHGEEVALKKNNHTSGVNGLVRGLEERLEYYCISQCLTRETDTVIDIFIAMNMLP